MTSSRKKPGVAFWATVVVVVLVAYPLSFGPACWIVSRLDSDHAGRLLQAVYWPVGRLAVQSELAERQVRWYGELGMRAGSVEVIYADPPCSISLLGPDPK